MNALRNVQHSTVNCKVKQNISTPSTDLRSNSRRLKCHKIYNRSSTMALYHATIYIKLH
ncbi:CLUMA_CG003933, isoform A [Clunio marinus]|uniref:CLUMA_CG003933, isoform A n=1 Tax=Clunio marinus TaxID=568069 RepID=A0A1J1HS60_9DIPT|nr:CLUMA_CG003933, isoform A [Clunio marinus]